MKMLYTNLCRVASSGPPRGIAASTLAALIKAAGLNEDLLARASYIEGLLGQTPGSIYKRPRPQFDAAREALDSGTPGNPIVEVLEAHGMSEKDIYQMVGYRDTGMFQALVWGAQKAMGGLQAIRGHSAEGIAQSIAAGISPLTLKWMKYGVGKGVFYWLGARAPSRVSLGGIVSIAGKEAFNRSLDIVRKTRKEETYAQSLSDGGEDEDSQAALRSVMRNPALQTDALQSSEVMVSLRENPEVLKTLDRAVTRKLRTPKQLAVWASILNNPDFLVLSARGVGIQSRSLARSVAEITGTEYTSSSEVTVRKIFNKNVLPAMQEALGDSDVAARLLRNRDLRELIEEATAPRMASLGGCLSSRVVRKYLSARGASQ